MKRWLLVLMVLTGLALGSAAGAKTIRFESGPERSVVIELFTSEGCSSCPPAEAYLNGYVDQPRLWDRYIPLAFHVHYWDYLGWKDRFGAPRYSGRQRHYVRLGHARTVYTPAFFVNGRVWRPVHGARPDAAAPSIGNLRVVLQGDQVRAKLSGANAVSDPVQLNVAVLGMGLRTQIRAGENAGREARHEFVVLGHKQLVAAGRQWRTPLPKVRSVAAERYVLVVWVSRAGDPTPLQAAGAYIPSAPVTGPAD